MFFTIRSAENGSPTFEIVWRLSILRHGNDSEFRIDQRAERKKKHPPKRKKERKGTVIRHSCQNRCLELRSLVHHHSSCLSWNNTKYRVLYKVSPTLTNVLLANQPAWGVVFRLLWCRRSLGLSALLQLNVKLRRILNAVIELPPNFT